MKNKQLDTEKSLAYYIKSDVFLLTNILEGKFINMREECLEMLKKKKKRVSRCGHMRDFRLWKAIDSDGSYI